jgi:hypothetical protein
MDILLFALVVLIIAAMVVYAVRYLPLAAPFDKLIIALVIVIAAYVIAQRAGLV